MELDNNDLRFLAELDNVINDLDCIVARDFEDALTNIHPDTRPNGSIDRVRADIERLKKSVTALQEDWRECVRLADE